MAAPAPPHQRSYDLTHTEYWQVASADQKVSSTSVRRCAALQTLQL